jgi:hypothetical protein
MIYLTGEQALNLKCSLETCGDWHAVCLKWDKESLELWDSEKSVFGDYGIEIGKAIPGHKEKYNVANHIRALLDLLEIGCFSIAEGMKEDFISNDAYTNEIFEKVMLLENSKNWFAVDWFMGKEYHSEWFDYKRKNTGRNVFKENKIIIKVAGGTVTAAYASEPGRYDVEIIDEDILENCIPRYKNELYHKAGKIYELIRYMQVIY